MIRNIFDATLVTAVCVSIALLGAPQSALADTASTTAIVAGAAGIIGALIYDANDRPYYINGGRRYYVSQSEANQYRQRHHGTIRRAYVPEQEMPVGRDANGGGHASHGDDHSMRR